MTETASPSPDTSAAQVAHEIAVEQAHVDRVYAELAKAARRAELVEAEGLARGRTDRTGDVRDEELTGLFERDALVFNAARRRTTLESQYEGLVFGRLDLEHSRGGSSAGSPVSSPDGSSGRPAGSPVSSPDGSSGRPAGSPESPDSSPDGSPRVSAREVRYIGRLGVRDDDYEPLVIDWRAPAASPFYRATPVEPMDVLRRRVLRCKGPAVVGVEDDLMVSDPPEDLVVVGDGALMAALTRSRGKQMRDIVATIQRHQDEAIRAPSRGVTEITGGPGTGKTVVALHRAAYLLYSERRRFETGGILVVGPSAAYTAYIERVLPSLGEESVTLRSLGDVVDGVTAVRLDSPEAAAIKGSLSVRQVLSRAAHDLPPGAPTEFRAFVAGRAVRVDAQKLRSIRSHVLRSGQHNLATAAARTALAEAAWVAAHREGERADFLDRFADSLDVDAFMAQWWPQLDPREVLLWLADPERARAYSHGVLSEADAGLLSASIQRALETAQWSVADAALVDDLSARLGPVQETPSEERGFYEIEEYDNLDSYGVAEVRTTGQRVGRVEERGYDVTPADARERLLHGELGRPESYAHILVDEAQDLSPMQWRMVGRRGRSASWTVVGDAAQASWPGAREAQEARGEAFGAQERRPFHMDTNYRNAREVFAYAREVILRHVPDADIPNAVRETGVEPRELPLGPDVRSAAEAALEDLVSEVEGSVAVITPLRYAGELAPLSGLGNGRVQVVDPMSTKGLEYDATVVVDPGEITAESPGGVRVLYVALTRAAHRMTVLS